MNNINLNYDIYTLLVKQIDCLETLQKFSCQNKYFLNFCKENTCSIAKHFLNKYKIDYADPTNFIYLYNKVNINNYKKIDGSWKLGSIFRLYLQTYNLETIICDNLGITSFPIYPNLSKFRGINNGLTSFPIQPNMLCFWGDNNGLTSFPTQPKMICFWGDDNNLTSFSIQPKMIEFYGENNKLTSFPIQPNMIEFSGDGNPLSSGQRTKITKLINN